MTKQYMEFEQFKQLVLEAASDDTDDSKKKSDNDLKNIYWQGGLFWGIDYDASPLDPAYKKTVSSRHGSAATRKRNREENAVQLIGTVTFYIAFLNDKLIQKQYDLVQGLFNNKIKQILQNEDLQEQWHVKPITDKTKYFGAPESVSEHYEHSDKYKLYKTTGKFSMDLNPNPDTDEDMSQDDIRNERKQKVYSEFNKCVSTFVKENGLYTQARLQFDDSTGFSSAAEWIKKMVKEPQAFGGYNTMLGNKKQIANMGWMEYISQAGANSATGFLGALLAKGVLGWKYKTKLNNMPRWTNGLKDFSVPINTEQKFDLKKFIDNYNKDVVITVSPESDYYSLDKTIFKYKFLEQNDYEIEFKLTYDKTEDVKKVKVHVSGVGESIIK